MDERRFFDRVVIITLAVRRLIHLKYKCRSINRKNAFDIFSSSKSTYFSPLARLCERDFCDNAPLRTEGEYSGKFVRSG